MNNLGGIGNEHKIADHIDDKKAHQSMIDDQGQLKMMTKDVSDGLTILLKPDDDFPHPRHLCFMHPFKTSSPKRYCSKCYCYVCEEVAPCKKWNKSSNRHCLASEKDKSWKLERQLCRSKVPGSSCKMAHHKLTISVFCESPDQLNHGYAGGVVCNDNGDWVAGFSMHVYNNIDPRDHTIPIYNALKESLKFAWSQGFRFLDIYLGLAFIANFWVEFSKDAFTKKFRLCTDPSQLLSPMIWTQLKEIEEYLNRKWFIDVKTTSSEEESGSVALAGMVDEQAEEIKVYDFTKYPDAEVMELAQETGWVRGAFRKFD